MRTDTQIEGEVVTDRVREAAAAAIAHRVVVRNVSAASVVNATAAHQQFRARVVERSDGLDVDGAGNAAGDQIRRLGLVDVGARDNFRWIDFPAHVSARLGRRNFAAVDQAQNQARSEAANGGLALIVAIARAIDAGQAHQRLGDGHIGQGADVAAGNCVDHEIGIAFDVERAFETGAETADHDYANVLGVGFSGSGLLRLLADRERRHGQRCHRSERTPKCFRLHEFSPQVVR